MRKILLSIILFAFFAVQSSLFAQEVKGKSVADDRSTQTELIISGNRIQFQNAPIGNKIEIFSIIGVKVGEIEVKSSSGEYVLNVPKGYYIIKLGGTVRKVAIK